MAERAEIERKKNSFYFWVHAVFRKYIEVTIGLILVLLVGVTFIFIRTKVEKEAVPYEPFFKPRRICDKH